ncbi:MAG: hypothetical protein MZU97_25780 [Bacillus subtilis]|nr:hypothetical protein [Bacillus subtilis]
MKKLRILLLFTLIAVAILACEIPGQTTTTTATTTDIGQITSWVEVATAAELLAAKKTDNLRLTADIDLLAVEWVPFGNQKEPFSGVFDGQGHTIANFNISTPHDDFVGFFGVVTGTILNLNLTGADIDYTTNFLHLCRHSCRLHLRRRRRRRSFWKCQCHQYRIEYVRRHSRRFDYVKSDFVDDGDAVFAVNL